MNDSQKAAAPYVVGPEVEESRGPKRRGRRRKIDRGLPDESSRRDLARTYLEHQTRLWPEWVASGLLPAILDAVIQPLADGLGRRFLEGVIEAPDWGAAGQPSVPLGAAYLRFSCDNSNPRSLDQQLKNVLERAARDRVFCSNGRDHRKGCRLRTYKSVKLLEDKILDFVRQQVLTKEVIETALADANHSSVEQARRPGTSGCPRSAVPTISHIATSSARPLHKLASQTVADGAASTTRSRSRFSNC